MIMQKAGTTEQAKPWERPGVLLGGCLGLLTACPCPDSRQRVPAVARADRLSSARGTCHAGRAWRSRFCSFSCRGVPLMKLAPGRISFYTIGLLICCALAPARRRHAADSPAGRFWRHLSWR